MTALLAIDPGNATGIAFRRADGSEVWRTWDLPGVGGARLSKFYDRLARLHLAERFQRVGYERPYQGPNATALEALRHFEAMILFWAHRCDLPCQGFQPPFSSQSGPEVNFASREVRPAARGVSRPSHPLEGGVTGHGSRGGGFTPKPEPASGIRSFR